MCSKGRKGGGGFFGGRLKEREKFDLLVRFLRRETAGGRRLFLFLPPFSVFVVKGYLEQDGRRFGDCLMSLIVSPTIIPSSFLDLYRSPQEIDGPTFRLVRAGELHVRPPRVLPEDEAKNPFTRLPAIVAGRLSSPARGREGGGSLTTQIVIPFGDGNEMLTDLYFVFSGFIKISGWADGYAAQPTFRQPQSILMCRASNWLFSK